MPTELSDVIAACVHDAVPRTCAAEREVPPCGASEPRKTEETSASATRRVLHVINGEYYSGAERVQDLLALRLPSFGYQAEFVCLRPGLFRQARASTQTPLTALPMRGRFDLRPARRLAERLRGEEVALLHAHTPRAALITARASRRAKVPWVYHVHSPAARDSTAGLKNRITAAVERFCIRKAAAVITVSESLRRHMATAGVDATRLHVVHNGVPIAETPRSADPPRGCWVLGTTALFRPRKGTEVLLHALARLREWNLPARLIAVGPFETSEYEAHLKRLAHELHLDAAVQWLGFRRDVAEMMRCMDLFVLPSLFGEGLPMVVLEAMALGLPVIASSVEGIPEAIRDGRDGVLVPPNDPDALASAAARFIRGELDWSAMARHARLRQRQSFSDISMAQGTAQVYDRVLAGLSH
ncbi:glycosyltransferase [Thermopirellula anaerolimosa]